MFVISNVNYYYNIYSLQGILDKNLYKKLKYPSKFSSICIVFQKIMMKEIRV
jgi:hypothetical protein